MATTTEQDLALTESGWRRLQAELATLKLDRQARLNEYMDAARGAETADARVYWESALISQIDQRIATLERVLGRALVIGAADRDRTTVGVGSRVVVRTEDDEEETYSVVGPPEADPSRDRVSYESPVGRALMGKRVGEDVEVATPAGRRCLTVLSID